MMVRRLVPCTKSQVMFLVQYGMFVNIMWKKIVCNNTIDAVLNCYLTKYRGITVEFML